MTEKAIHYEVFRRADKKASWKLVEAHASRADAIKFADALIASNQAIGVRVMKETYHEQTGTYQPLKIYEAGQGDHINKKGKFDGPEDTPLCFQPLDLFSVHARQAIARLMPDHLARLKLTAIEMIHRPDALEDLSRTGTLVQHAIQKTAIAQARDSGRDVQSIVRLLNDLTTKAMEIVFKDFRSGRFPKIADGGLTEVYRKVEHEGDADYLLNCAIAAHIADAKGWGEKLAMLLELMDGVALDDEHRAVCLAAVDRFIAEMLVGHAAIADLLGPQESLGHALLTLADLFLGALPAGQDGLAAGMVSLSKEFKAGRLSHSRSAVGQRILRELRSVRPLITSSLGEEVRLARKIAGKMVVGQGPDLPLDQITDAFRERSKRFVAAEAVEKYLERFDEPIVKVEKLLALEDNIVGRENKRTLAAYLVPILTSQQIESTLANSTDNILARLKRLRDMQVRIRDGKFQEANKAQLIAAIGALAGKVEDKAGFFAMVAKKSGNSMNEALTVLRLIDADTLPAGDVLKRAEVRVLKAVQAQPLAGALAALKSEQSGDEKLQELQALMDRHEIGRLKAASA